MHFTAGIANTMAYGSNYLRFPSYVVARGFQENIYTVSEKKVPLYILP